MLVKVACWRSDALAERGVWKHGPASVTLGPYEYVELNYSYIRVAPNGDCIGQIEDGDWYIDGHDEPFSDISIYAAEE